MSHFSQPIANRLTTIRLANTTATIWAECALGNDKSHGIAMTALISAGRGRAATSLLTCTITIVPTSARPRNSPLADSPPIGKQRHTCNHCRHKHRNRSQSSHGAKQRVKCFVAPLCKPVQQRCVQISDGTIWRITNEPCAQSQDSNTADPANCHQYARAKRKHASSLGLD